MTSPPNAREFHAASDPLRPAPDVIRIDFPSCIAAEFPSEFPLAWSAVEATLEAIQGADLSPLARHSPALAHFDWNSYLRCSVARMVRALSTLRTQIRPGARVLDYGSYFGNFARMLRNAGYQVDAADAYTQYAGVFSAINQALRRAGIGIVDTGTDALAERTTHYDAVLLMGVIEHIPHTPRFLLETLDGLLRPGGVLVLDTPNLAYLYTRQRLARGDSIFCPIALQYHTELPFEGHHREYTTDEVKWLLAAVGHENIQLDTFNYSFYGLTELSGADLENFRKMSADPSAREVILAVSRKPRRPI